ncbi:MAG TPA: proline racemase family protein [Geminicoccaceae bacterium]
MKARETDMAGIWRRMVQTIDSHTEGNSTRVITGGYPVPPGTTLLEKRAWLWHHDDGLRRMLNFEPRGHGMMCSVLLLPPCVPEADVSVIIMEQDEYVPMCGHCIIGTATTLVTAGLVPARAPVTTLTIETPAGLVACEVEVRDGRAGPASFTNVESFLLHERAEVEVEGFGRLAVDVAYGGDFYAIVDADRLGLELGPEHDAALIAFARALIPAVNRQLAIRHPERPDIDRCYQTLLTSTRTTSGDLKQTIVCPPGSLDRSPCGTGTSARLAAMVTRGELGLDQPRRFEGVLGTCFEGRAIAAEERGGVLYVRPRVTGRAWITGFHQFVLDPSDPLPEGFRIGHPPRPAPAPA